MFLDSGETIRVTIKEREMTMNEEMNDAITPWYLCGKSLEYETQLMERLKQDRLEREAALLNNAAAADEEEEENHHEG